MKDFPPQRPAVADVKENRLTRISRIRDLRTEAGQATAEYALVLVAAAVVALALITWASTTDMLPTFFHSVMQKVISVANRA